MGGECAARPRRIQVRAPHHRAARFGQPLRHLFEADGEFGVGLMAESAIREAYAVDVGFPHQRGALDHLPLHVLRRLEARPARLERSAAAARHRCVADGFSIAHLRVHILNRNAQHFGELLRRRRPRAAYVHRADGEVDRAVVVHIGGSARRARAVHPKAGCHAAPAVRALKRRLIVVVFLGGHVRLYAADNRIHHAVRAPRPLFRAVHNAKVQRVYVQTAADFVDNLLCAKRRARRPRRPIRRSLGLVVHHIVAVKPQVLDIIRRVDAVHRGAHRRTGIRARFVLQIRLNRRQLALIRSADFHPHQAARSRPRRLKHIRAAHRYLDRMPALARQRRRHRLQVDRSLAAEAAADFHRHNLDARMRYPQHARRAVAYLKMPLRAAPYRNPAIRLPPRRCGMRLDVSLMHRLGAKHALHHHIRRREALAHIAQRHLGVACDIAFIVSVKLRRVRRDSLFNRACRRQNFILHVDELQRFFGGVRAAGRHRRDGVSLVERLIARQHIIAQMLQVHGRPGGQHPRLIRGVREIGGSDNRHNFGMRLCLARIDRHDIGVSVRTSQHLAVQHSRQIHISAVERLARNLVIPIVPNGALADHIIFFVGQNDARCHKRLASRVVWNADLRRIVTHTGGMYHSVARNKYVNGELRSTRTFLGAAYILYDDGAECWRF